MPDDNGGYVRIYRSILDNPTFQSGEEAMFFAYLVLKANWKPRERRYDDRVYRLDRGEMVIGMRKLAEEFGWSHKRVRNIFRRLIAGDMVVLSWAQHGAQRAPVTTICNYEEFQAPIDERAQGGAQGGAHLRKKGRKVKKRILRSIRWSISSSRCSGGPTLPGDLTRNRRSRRARNL